MSEHIAHTEHDEETGVTLKIINDPHGSESPLEHDSAVIFAVLHRRYINPAKDAAAYKRNGDSYDFTTVEGIAEFEKANGAINAQWAVFPLFMYDHSGTIYSASSGANPFHCPWDSGRVGIIALKKSEVGKPGKKVRNAKREVVYTVGSYLEQAQAVAKNYTDWANGNIWGYVVEDADGEHIDSCWGFIGDHDDEHLMAEAHSAYHDAIKDANAANARDLEADRADMYAGA